MTPVKAFFDQIHSVIATQLTQARASIQVATAWIGDQELIDRLAEKARQGVAVDLIVSGDSHNEASEARLEVLQQAGANVMVWGARRDHENGDGGNSYGSLMHHKFCVIDGKILINGSLNWTRNARNNRENIVIMNHAAVARRFADQFWLLRNESKNWFSGEPSPFDATFTADTYRVAAGSEVKLSWEVNGASEVMLNGKAVPSSGFSMVAVKQTTTFRLRMVEGDSEASRTLTVEALAKPGAKISASANSLVAGDKVTLTWNTEGADKVKLLPGNLELSTAGTIELSPTEHTVYTLEASNDAGTTTTSCQVRVFQVPRIAALHIPLPVELRTNLTVEFQEFTAPATIHPANMGKGVSLRFPSIRSIGASLTGKQPVAVPATPRKRLFDAFDDLKNSIRGIIPNRPEF